MNLVIINGDHDDDDDDDDDDDEDDDSSEDKENDYRSGDDNNDDEIIETFLFYPLFIPLNSYLLFFESPRELWSQTREAGRRPRDRRHCESKDWWRRRPLVAWRPGSVDGRSRCPADCPPGSGWIRVPAVVWACRPRPRWRPSGGKVLLLRWRTEWLQLILETWNETRL